MFFFNKKREKRSNKKYTKKIRLLSFSKLSARKLSWLKIQLIKFFLISFSVFFAVVYFSPSDAHSNQSNLINQSTSNIEEIQSSSCPVIFHRFVGGAYGLEVEREELDPAFWLMVDSKKQVKQLKKNQIQLLSYEQFIKKLSPASVGVVSSTIYKAYGDIQKVYFFRGNSVDISKSERSTCLDNLAKQKAGLKKDI